MTPFEIGTDLSASIRIPTAYCGVFALKTTEHRVPVTGLIPGLPRHEAFASCPVSAPWRELLKILMLLYSIIAGSDGRDTDVSPVPIDDIPEVALKNLRVAFAPTFPGFPVAAEIRNTVEELATQLQPLCVKVAESTPSTLDFSRELSGAA